MKTILQIKQSLIKLTSLICVLAIGVPMKAQIITVLSDGLKFTNPSLVTAPSTDLQAGAKYLFSNVTTGVDAVVTIDSLVNGAEINKIDDNSAGTGYVNAFQPAVKSGNVIGKSYAVFNIAFFATGTSNPVTLKGVYATPLDIDGNATLKEFAEISMNSTSLLSYILATPDILVSSIGTGKFLGKNILGIERSGIDTASLGNMFTVNSNSVSAFTVKYGTETSNRSTAVRQFSMYMKGFQLPAVTLPVKMSSFSVALNNKKADLVWKTATEQNVSYFMVEKSTDGINFSDAAMVFAFGNSNAEKAYNYSDNVANVTAHVVYYRLRSVDNDGKTQFSEIRIVKLTKAQQAGLAITTYPNPVANELRITNPGTWQNKNVTYEIFSLSGQVVSKTTVAAASQTETTNISKLQAGVYMVKATCNGEVATQKIVKQ